MIIVKLVVYCTILFYEQIMFECVRKVTCQINEINADEPYHMKDAVFIILQNSNNVCCVPTYFFR